MSHFTRIAGAAVAALALTTAAIGPAAAQSQAHKTESIYIATPNKVMEMANPSQAKIDMLMKFAKKLPAGSIVYTSDGALWLAQDTKMADGMMLGDSLMH